MAGEKSKQAKKERKAGKNSADLEKAKEQIKDEWKPKTSLGKKVKNGEINDIEPVLDEGEPVLESEIVDILPQGFLDQAADGYNPLFTSLGHFDLNAAIGKVYIIQLNIN